MNSLDPPAIASVSQKLRAWTFSLVVWAIATAIAVLLTMIVGVSEETLEGQSVAGYGLGISLALTIVLIPLFVVSYFYWRRRRPPLDDDPNMSKRVAYIVGLAFAVLCGAAFVIAVAASSETLAVALVWLIAIPIALLGMRRELRKDTRLGTGRGSVDVVQQPDAADLASPAPTLQPPPPPTPVLPAPQPAAPPAALQATPPSLDKSIDNAAESDSATELRLLIVAGESQTLELKSSARWNVHANRSDKKMEHVITKTVCGFLNAEGGTLVIGVDDDGKPVGLANDFGTLGKKQDRDHYELWLRQHLDSNLSVHTAGLVQIRFETLDSEDVSIVEVVQSRKAVFARPAEGGSGRATEFWVRSGNATNQLVGDDMIHYQSHHWGWWPPR